MAGPPLWRRLLPHLARSHPGYFKVAVGLTLAHAFLGVDALLGSGMRHPLAQWQFVYGVVGGHLWVWGGAHWAIVVLAVTGLYWKFALAKLAWLLSLLEFNALAFCFLIAFLTNDAPLFPIVVTLASSLSSLAAFLENPINPMMRSLARRRE